MKALALLLVSSACAVTQGDSPDLEQESSATRYVHILDFEKIDQSAWYDGIHSLNQQFDDICGDTFCEGEYTNLEPLTFACSVTSKAGKVKDCAWTFAASQLDVDPRNANIIVDGPTYECHIKMQTTAVKLAAILAGEESLYAPLPGAPAETPSIYDQLSECFENPIGQTTGEYATEGAFRYVSSRDFYSGSGIDRWFDARRALRSGFDNICGDTFCSGDYSDMQFLDLQCAITRSTGNVKTCAWVIGGSYFYVPERTGQLIATHDTWTCPFDPDATFSQLLNVWNAPGTTPAINRPLPNSTSSAYDALFGCLP